MGGGLDIERDQAQGGAVVGGRLHLRVAQHAALVPARVPMRVRLAVEPDRRGDEAFHQVALGRADIGLVDIHASLPQRLVDPDQLAVLLAVQPEHGPAVEVLQLEQAQFHVPLAAQQRLGLIALGFGQESDRRLGRQAQQARPVVRGQPEIDLGTGGGIAPVPGQDEALLKCHAGSLSKTCGEMLAGF
ncbi:hypothetical protein D3C81_1707960 [compost metagenome]